VAVASLPSVERTAIADWLASEGFDPLTLATPNRIADELKARTFELLVVDVALAGPAINSMRAHNPLAPVVVVGPPDPAAESQAAARGATYLARPLDRALFICTISMAVMESRPPRRSERKRAQVDVVVQGVPSRIIDVSREGMRLAIPRLRKAAPPPPWFDVNVPILGVSLNVRRLWMTNPPQPAGATIWYGGELSNNTRRVELAWHTLVDALPGSRTSVEVQ
jgi:hypothetical protein